MQRLLAAKSHEELLQLLRDLYALCPEVQDFLHARLQISAAHVKPYKKDPSRSRSLLTSSMGKTLTWHEDGKPSALQESHQ